MRGYEDDDDAPAIGGDESGRVLPGSPLARRRHYLEDDGLTGPGVEDLPKLKRQRRPTGLWERWLMAIEPVLRDSSSTSSPFIRRAIFNAHVKAMRVDYNDDEILAAFKKFAELVKAGKIHVHGKNAWLTFYAWRTTLLRREVSDSSSDTVDLPEGLSEVGLGEGLSDVGLG